MHKIIFFVFILSFNLVFASKPYVILVSFDGFRWDYLNRGITPNIQKLIDSGVTAQSLRPAFPSKTFPNHYSIITGMYTETHGIVSNNFRNPETGEWYDMGDAKGSKNNCKWYLGEAFWETAEKNGIKSASYFWPSSTINDSLRIPSISKKYDRSVSYKARIDSLIKWLKYPSYSRPYFSSIYFEDTDDYGHYYGPNSKGIDTAIKRCDSLTAYLVDGLSQIGLLDSVNIILTSDHGMTYLSKDRIINIEELLNGLDYHSSDNGPFMLIQPAEKDRDDIKQRLLSNEINYRFFERDNMPRHFHYSKNNRIPDFILVADLGWFLANQKDIDQWSGNYNATHGYDNNLLDMHGIFVGSGPAFKTGYKSGTIWNIDIYPLLCEIYNIKIPDKIDGNLERIGFFLENK